MENLTEYFTQHHRPVWAEIDLDNVVHNMREFQRILSPQTRIMAVVKSRMVFGNRSQMISTTGCP